MIDRRSFMLAVGASTIAACVRGSDVLAAVDDLDQASDVTDVGHEIWRRAGGEHKIDGLILFAISVHETGKRDPESPLKPWPYSVNTPKGPIYAADRAAAERLLVEWENDDRLDIGLMQVNLGVHRERVSDPLHLIDPATNVRIGAQILAEAIAVEHGDVWAGVGRYHSADPKRSQPYVTEVEEVFRRLTQQRANKTPNENPVPAQRRSTRASN